MTIIRFKNARIAQRSETDGSRKLLIGDVWIKNGKIIDPEPLFYGEKKEADITIDCKQLILAPGYIDLQINGGFGFDFSTNDAEIETALTEVATNLVKFGVTSFCPTVISGPSSSYKQLLPKIKRGPRLGGATILGIHIEGPFLNVEKRGAHPANFVQNNIESEQQIEDYYQNLSNVSIITLAPELDRKNIVRKLVDRGLIVSLGHSNANLEESERAFKNGASMITHLFNAMPLFHHRDPGLLGLLTVESERHIYYGIIADGIHTHYSALRLAYRANPNGMVLVSDAVSATGLASGFHVIGSQKIEVKGDRALVAGTETLCGSTTTLDAGVRYLKRMVNSCSVIDAIECATLHPAQVLGIETLKGTLRFGADADIVLLNDELEVLATFVAGRCVYVQSNKNQLDISELNRLK